ncbi:MAG: DNA polymerase III subunit gamma/tau [Bacteroidales bacterium]|nr:DNA polymerase III subunit gamma/tau [Bacteroidales bacterium]
MSEYIVSARKYRPSTFNMVVGQDAVVITLKNAIKNNQISHAYLFCGPRGVGKTTCARILAKAINCTNLTQDIEPCNECESCVNFNKNALFNIHELDAASNNSVEAIRDLISHVRIPPQSGKYSVYIIDEVHMLTKEAFNAFLKTLEEPPLHAIFILATTEKHKVIPTVVSRCQVFDFRRIFVKDIVQQLKYVATQEKITYEEEALNIIAQKADGSMRDALSIFDQIASFSDNHITYENVIKILNILDYDYYFTLVNCFLENNFSNALLLLADIIFKGFDLQYFIYGLAEHFRNLLMCKNENTIKLLEVSENIANNYLNQSKKCTLNFIYKAMDIINETDVQYRTSYNKRFLIELMLLKLTNITSVNTLQQDFNTLSETQVNFYRQASNIKQGESKPLPDEKSIQQNYIANELSTSNVKKVGEAINANITDYTTTHDKSINKEKKIKITPEIPKIIINTTPTQDNVGNKVEDQNVATLLTPDQIIAIWNKYFQEKAAKEKPLQSVLKNSSNFIKAELNKLIFSVSNNVLAKEIEQLIPDIKLYFKSHHNVLIEIEIKVTEDQINLTKPYTSKEKFEYLSKKYPQLIYLKNKLDLDFY